MPPERDKRKNQPQSLSPAIEAALHVARQALLPPCNVLYVASRLAPWPIVRKLNCDASATG